ncbi:MAG: hypothetical protein ACRDZM_16130 [Acidimicrobiia bacterium]
MSRGLAFLRGAACGCTAGILIFGIAVTIGLAPTESGLVFAGGAVAGAMAAGLSRWKQDRIEAGGAAAVAMAGLVAGAVTGLGLLEYSVIGGSVLAAVWSIVGRPGPRDPWAWFRWGGIVVALLVVVLLPLIVAGGVLGHDESAYALKARQWLEATPGSGWSPHRGIAMSAYGYLVLAGGGGEAALRSIGLLGAAGLVMAAWFLGRRMSNPRVGAFAACGVAAGPAVLYRGTEYLSDLPAASLLASCMAILWWQLEDGDLPGHRLLWFLVPAWVAFYLRYQSALSLGLIAILSLFLWWPKIRRRPRPVIWLGVIGLAGLVPHVVQSVDLTGKPWGILANTTTGAVRAYVGEGLADYANQFPWHVGGYALPIAMSAAVAGLVVWWRSDVIWRRLAFLLAPALIQVLALGLISHGEPRFVFFPLLLVVVAGSIVIDRTLSAYPGPLSGAPAMAVAILVAGSLALSATFARTTVENRQENNEPVMLAALEVARGADGDSCGVLTSYRPQITFYSRCSSQVFRLEVEPSRAVAEISGNARFLVLIEGGKSQPDAEYLDALVALSSGSPVVVTGVKRDGTVYAFDRG